jgi:hypothetical protein
MRMSFLMAHFQAGVKQASLRQKNQTKILNPNVTF